MTDKMTLLYVKQTGHVLGALTRVADPDSAVTAEALAQGGLLVRGFSTNEQFEVPPEQLKALTVDLEEVILLSPRDYVVNEEDQTTTEVPAAPTPATATLKATVLTTNQVTVELNATTPTEVKVCVQIEGGTLTQPQIAAGKIAASAAKVDIQIETLGSGQYTTLTLATARPPQAKAHSI